MIVTGVRLIFLAGSTADSLSSPSPAKTGKSSMVDLVSLTQYTHWLDTVAPLIRSNLGGVRYNILPRVSCFAVMTFKAHTTLPYNLIESTLPAP